MGRWISVLLFLVVLSVPAVGEGPDGDGPPVSLDDFELMQYLAAGRLSPQRVMGLDNNGEILLACRQGCTLDELAEGDVSATASQLQLLRVMNLLAQDPSGRWKTNFPILDAETSAALRAESRELAQLAFAALRPQIEALQRALEARDLESHAHAIFFSYVLDGMAWGFLEEYGRVPARRLSAARPFWAGEIWALETARDDWVGTATIADRGLTLRVLMSRSVEERLRPLLGGRLWIKRALKEYLEAGRVADSEALKLLQIYGIANAEGTLLVPVIDEIGRDGVFLAAESLTSDLIDWIFAELDFEPLRARYELRNEPQTLVIIYHELMWSLLSILEEKQIIERPAVLDGGGTVKSRDLAQLILLVDRANRVEREDSDVETAVPEQERDES